jgi:hypothetical protein
MALNATSQSTRIGWHPDPAGGFIKKYWDGQQWLDAKPRRARRGLRLNSLARRTTAEPAIASRIVSAGNLPSFASGECMRDDTTSVESPAFAVPRVAAHYRPIGGGN